MLLSSYHVPIFRYSYLDMYQVSTSFTKTRFFFPNIIQSHILAYETRTIHFLKCIPFYFYTSRLFCTGSDVVVYYFKIITLNTAGPDGVIYVPIQVFHYIYSACRAEKSNNTEKSLVGLSVVESLSLITLSKEQVYLFFCPIHYKLFCTALKQTNIMQDIYICISIPTQYLSRYLQIYYIIYLLYINTYKCTYPFFFFSLKVSETI